MGTWGTGIFEDDTACDFVDDLMSNSNTIDVLKWSIEKGLNFDYLEAPDATEIAVSAAIIDSLLNNTKLKFADGELERWIEKKNKLDVQPLKLLAASSLKGILAENSELNELWQENEEEYPIWKNNIVQLIDRLS